MRQHSKPRRWRQISEFARRFRPRVVSTAIALTWVATGQRAAYITDGNIMQKGVDFAAGIAICEARLRRYRFVGVTLGQRAQWTRSMRRL
jgi:hypothetical protein